MGFWIFMFICICLIPVSMIVFGALFMSGRPRKPNIVFGYRTKRSSRDANTWRFAHQYIGRLWFWLGLLLLIPSFIVMILWYRASADSVGTASGILIILQLAVLIIPIFPTEHQLKKHFDDRGYPKPNP